MHAGWKKNTVLFLTSQALSLFGTMLVQYAILWHIVLKTQSGAMMTLYIIAGVLPTFFTSLFGGVWADRYNKKHIINISDGSIAAVSLAIALTLFAGHDSLVLLLIAAMVRALGQGVQQPAVTSLIPFIVPEDRLLRVNGIMGSIQSGIFLASPVISASLMALAPLEALFFIDVITASIAIAILYFLVKVPHAGKKESPENVSQFRDLINGLKYIRRERYLSLLIIFSALFTIFVSPLAIMSPLQVTRNFGPDLWRLSAIEIGFAGGMMLGGVLVGTWCFRNKVFSIAMASTATGMLTILLGVWTSFIPYLACMAVSGIAVPYFNAPSLALIQEKVAPDYLGRALSIFTMIGSLAMPFAMLFFGPLGDIININYIFIGTGVVMMLLGVLFFLNRTLRAAGASL